MTLGSFRCLMIAALIARGNPGLKIYGESAANNADSTRGGVPFFEPSFAASWALRASYHGKAGANREAEVCSTSALSSCQKAMDYYHSNQPPPEESNGFDLFSALESDIAAATVNPDDFGRDRPLWSSQTYNDHVEKAESNFFGWLNDEPWLFWREWYTATRNGRDWASRLQQQVAQIDDEIWGSGPYAVAREIEKIRATFDLEKRILELETELRRATVNRHGIGGNMPPEMLEDATIAQELVIVWEPLEDLKSEISKDDPDPTRLHKIVESIITALNKGFVWCLKKGDLVVDTAIKWAIPASGTGYLALNPDKIEAVIETAKKLLAAL